MATIKTKNAARADTPLERQSAESVRRKIGMPPKRRPVFLDAEDPNLHKFVKKLASLGYTNMQISDRLGISPGTLLNLRKRSAEFDKALKDGAYDLVDLAASTLVDAIHHGDVKAAMFALRCRGGWSYQKEEPAIAAKATAFSVEWEESEPEPPKLQEAGVEYPEDPDVIDIEENPTEKPRERAPIGVEIEYETPNFGDELSVLEQKQAQLAEFQEAERQLLRTRGKKP